MYILVLALAILPSLAVIEDKDPAHPLAPGRGSECQNAEIQRARATPNPVRPGKLGQQPAADQYLTVLRVEGGCDKPVKIRQGVGAGGEDRR